MRVALDGIPLSQPLTGVGHYTLELARALGLHATGDEFQIISPLAFSFPCRGATLRDGLPANVSLVHAHVNFLTRRWWTIGLPRYAARHSLDLFHGTNFEVPVRCRRPTVLTIHDLSRLLRPDTHEKRMARRAQRRLPFMARAATMIITPTEVVRREVCEHLGAAAEKVVAVSEAARAVFQPMLPEATAQIRRQLGVGENFLLFVGTIEPRKNLLTLLRAFEEIGRSERSTLQLVLAGKRGWLVDELLEQVRRSRLADLIRLTDYVSDEQLQALYSSCRIFVYPSTYEGFGLPPLEAMACGAPVIAGRIASIAEVCGDAAILVTPQSVDAVARAIVELIDDEAARARLRSAGLRRAAEFSWQRTAKMTSDVYEEAVRRFHGPTAPQAVSFRSAYSKR